MGRWPDARACIGRQVMLFIRLRLAIVMSGELLQVPIILVVVHCAECRIVTLFRQLHPSNIISQAGMAKIVVPVKVPQYCLVAYAS